MASLTIRSIPPEILERLRESAKMNRRSLNSEAIECLERALMVRRVDRATLARRIEALQKRLDMPPLTDETLKEFKSEGRP